MSELVPVLSQTEIQERVKSLAYEISADYAGKSLVAIGVLKGAFIFLADLVRHISVPTQIDFVRLASYGADAKSSGKIRITKDIELDIKGKDVLVVEDIIDSGLTLAFLLKHLETFSPLSVKICALVDKTERREKEITLDYTGFTIESGFIVGYGIDFNENYRTLPDIKKIKL